VRFTGHPFDKIEEPLNDDLSKGLKPSGNESHPPRAEVEQDSEDENREPGGDQGVGNRKTADVGDLLCRKFDMGSWDFQVLRELKREKTCADGTQKKANDQEEQKDDDRDE